VAALLKQMPKSGNISQERPATLTPSSYIRPTPLQAAPVQPMVEEHQSAKKDLTQEHFDAVWPKVIARIKKSSPMTALALEQVSLKELGTNRIKLTFANTTHYNTIQSNQVKLQALLAEYFTKPVNVELIQVEGEKPSRVDIKRRSLEDLKAESVELANYITATDSILI